MKKDFANGKKTISANEINKFTYCRYQWFYERVYGTPQLRALHKEKIESLNLDYSESSPDNHFIRGLDFHEKFGRFEKLEKAIKIFIVFAVFIVFVLFLLFQF